MEYNVSINCNIASDNLDSASGRAWDITGGYNVRIATLNVFYLCE